MKKQNKQRDAEPKQNTTPAPKENTNRVSDETKSKLVKQYRDRADATSSEWKDYDLPKNFVNSDDGFPEEKHLASDESTPERRPTMLGGDGNPIDFVSQQPEALTHAIYDDYGFLPSPRAEYSSGGRDGIQNADHWDSLGDYNRFFTQDALNNEMSGPDANAIYYANGMTVPERNLINQIANLAYNKVENERINQQEYQKALIAQALQPQTPQGLSLLEQLGNRPLSRQRNITGSATW